MLWRAGRGLLQAPVQQDLAGDTARDSLTRLTYAQGLAAATAAATPPPAAPISVTPSKVHTKYFPYPKVLSCSSCYLIEASMDLIKYPQLG